MNNRSENELKQMVAEAVRQYQAVESGADSSPMHEPVAEMSSAEAARLIDHTLLKPETTEAQIRQLCEEAKAYQFASVCVNPTWVALCRTLLIDSPVKVCTVVGFPLGATLPEVKSGEAERVIQSGAHEVDMVINVGRLKGGDHQSVFQDIISVVGTAHRSGAVVKAIIETALLTEDEKVAACVLAQAAGVDFVKTSTGFSGGGATVADVALMRRVVGPELGVKAAGGVRTAASLRSMVAAGATRIGASSSVQIINEFMAQKDGGDAGDEDTEADDSQGDSAPIQETGEMY